MLYQWYGIQYAEQEEPYTSKASFLDNDEIPNWSGESKEYEVSDHRVHRGLYKFTPTVSGAPARVRGSWHPLENLRPSGQGVRQQQADKKFQNHLLRIVSVRPE